MGFVHLLRRDRRPHAAPPEGARDVAVFEDSSLRVAPLLILMAVGWTALTAGLIVYEMQFHREHAMTLLGFTAGWLMGLGGLAAFWIALSRRIAARDRTALALRESEQRYRAVVDNVGIGISVLGRDLRVLSVNRQMQKWFPEMDPEGHPVCYRCFNDPPRSEPCGYCPVVKTFTDGKVHEAITKTPAGEGIRNYRVVSSPLCDEQGRVDAVIELVEDVTEQRRAEKRLEASEQKFRIVFEHSAEAMFIADAETGNIVDCNRQASALIGRSRSEIVGMNQAELHPPYDHDRYREHFHSHSPQGDTQDLEAEVLRANGSRVPVWISSQRAMLNGRDIIVGLFIDLTERKRFEQELAVFKQFAESSGQGFGMSRMDRRITYLNPAICRMAGLGDREQGLGADFLDFYTLESQETLKTEVLPAIMEGKQWIGELTTPRPDGSTLPTRTNYFAVYDEHDQPRCLAALVTDMSEQKRTEAALREAAQAAEAASRAKSEFLANMSHEIRTPLNAVLGMTELALDTDLTPEQREYLTMVHGSGQSLLTLINDILDFSKIEAGKLGLDPQPTDLRDVVGETLKTLGIRAAAKDLELSCRIAPEVPQTVVADPGRLRQILVNLVGNAIKFTDKGEVAVEILLNSAEEDDVELLCRVRDTGIGIDPSFRKRIFSSFEQVDSSTTRLHGGTGLGLAISSRLVDMMDGQIGVESTPGEGSTFHFTVRLGRTDEAPAGVIKNLGEFDGAKVLVVDDNPTNRRILHEILHAWRMEPVCVSDAFEALSAIDTAVRQDAAFRLLIVDACMPGMDGFELVRKLKRERALPGTAVLMLSSAAETLNAQRRRELGVDLYLTKPISQSELFDAICRALYEDSATSCEPHREARWDGPSLRVLLAEDNTVNQKLAERILTKAGHDVTTASDGKQAVALWEAHQFDLVLMDVQMPVIDGLEATQQIRKREAGTGQRTPVLALTAHALDGDEQRCLSAGMDGYVSKPIQTETLLERMAELAGPREEGMSSKDAEKGPNMHEEDAAVDQPVDRVELLGRIGQDRALLGEVIDAFFAEQGELKSTITKAVEDGDTEALHKAAHALKGAAGSLSAKPVFDAALNLEMMGRHGRLDHAAEALSELKRRLDKLTGALRRIRQEASECTS
jgi:PAS domain S-box-containing protein